MIYYNTMWRFFNRQSTNASFNGDCPLQEGGGGVNSGFYETWMVEGFFGGLNFGGKKAKQVFLGGLI